ncbi:MAG: shikimate dehydrogenase [Elusimicrobiota bacterium]|jgi:shikimate dehydrogenase|nr:shikimate dehydrogenase [Elusimicrobiota bacterium]
MIDVSTKLFAILGHPVKHTLSPQIHNAWFKREKLNCAYCAFDVLPENLGQTLEILVKIGFCGFNITAPHKIEIMNFVERFDKTAKSVGNVNTIAVKNNKICGYNTDFLGLEKDFAAQKIEIKNKKVFIYGAGGAAKTVLCLMKKNKADAVYISNRTKEKAVSLAEKFKCKTLDLKDIPAFIKDADIIVNASSCGFITKDILPFKNPQNLKKGAVICDLIYNKETPMIKLAKETKTKFFSGEGMLIYQAQSAFEIWTGKSPDIRGAFRILKKLLK